jgi:hypothetical protein
VRVKKLLVMAAAVAGFLFYKKKVQESEARKTVWSESTDKVE